MKGIPKPMAINIGNHNQLFIDDLFFEKQENIELSIHQPYLEEKILIRDQPWESRSLDTPCILKDGDLYKMWYRADEGSRDKNSEDKSWVCYAESLDCISWNKPKLGICEWQGSTDNNIVFPASGIDGVRVKNPSVIIDPNAAKSEKYKMIARTIPLDGSDVDHQTPTHLVAYVSDDGLNWKPVESNPILKDGPFDTHNVLVWDDESGKYVVYIRGVDKSIPGPFKGGVRAVRRSESVDFLTWSMPELVLSPDKDDPENLQFYTNAAFKYQNAARTFLMFPMTFYQDRKYPNAPFTGLSDVVFALSRDGINWKRPFRQPFVPPGLDERNWVDRNPMMGHGIVDTGPETISMILQDLHKDKENGFRKCTIRKDGFISVDGPYNGWGEFTTPPLIFSGQQLELNYSTGAGGSIFVELQNESGQPIKNFALENCKEIFGDKIRAPVSWSNGINLNQIGDSRVKIRIRFRDASIFAFRFS